MMNTLDVVRRALWAVAGLDHNRQVVQLATRALVETIFATHLLTSLHGLPALPPGSDLALLPYALPPVMTWKRRAQMAGDVTEKAALPGC